MNGVEEIKRYIREINELHLKEEAYLVKELGEFGVGSGFELGRIPIPYALIKRKGTNSFILLILLEDFGRMLAFVMLKGVFAPV